jgi:hypothetical protein
MILVAATAPATLASQPFRYSGRGDLPPRINDPVRDTGQLYLSAALRVPLQS